MEIIDRIVGIWMIAAGAEMFALAHMLEPYMATLSGITLYAVAISTAILIALPLGCMFAIGAAQAIGLIIIRIEGGK
jgi:hypothetical protein